MNDTLSSPGEPLGDFFVRNNKVAGVSQFNHNIHQKGVSFYEVVRVQEQVPLFAEDHIERLINSAARRKVPDIPGRSLIMDNLILLVKANRNYGDGNIRLLLHCEGDCTSAPVIYGYFIPHHYPSETEYREGARLITINAERHDVHCKIVNTQFRVSITSMMIRESAAEALLVNSEGYVTEGSKSNFFGISGNQVITPPVEDVLPGITRKYILEICKREGINCRERKIHRYELPGFGSCFITGTSPGVLAVRSIDSHAFSPGHPLLKELSRNYLKVVQNYIDGNKP